ncbi:DUF4189 domain-containing protein [Pseudomonas sp. CGJS7]|uniref:DUF4189 domain-containing protein n=1 Tax=Pseudomonas sp. CGJS7 TaxID=3109348 RepID=UPI003008B250
MDVTKKILLLPALALLGWSLDAGAICSVPGAQQQQQCVQNFVQNVIIPHQQAMQAAAQNQPPPPPPTPMEMMRERAQAQARKGWGAVAASPGLAQVAGAGDVGSQRKAESAALKACADRGGQGCAVLASANNACVAVARNADAQFASGTGPDEIAASRVALSGCNGKSPDKLCNLVDEPLCSGTAGGLFHAQGLSGEQRARLFEVAADDRLLWGALAGNGKAVYAAANALSQAQALSEAAAKCGGGACKPIAAHSNSCLAAAWPKKGGAPFVAESDYPEAARIDALSQCSAVHGAACAVSAPNCAGRAYVGYDFARVHTGAKAADTDRGRQPGAALLEPWVNRAEAEFRAHWGEPSDTTEVMRGESRLTYDKSFQSKAGAQRSCKIAVFTRAYRVFSYLTEGNACAEVIR